MGVHPFDASPLRVIDERDPEGEERIHPDAELEAATGVPRDAWAMPAAHSGANLRVQENVERFVAGLQEHARAMLAAWEAAGDPGNVDRGYGGLVAPYPFAIVVRNYGASIYADRRRARVRFTARRLA